MSTTKKPELTVVANRQLGGKVSATIAQQTSAHEAFLNARQVAQKQMAELIDMQAKIASGQSVDSIPSSLSVIETTPVTVSTPAAPVEPAPQERIVSDIKLVERYNKPENIVFDTEALVEFAEGVGVRWWQWTRDAARA